MLVSQRRKRFQAIVTAGCLLVCCVLLAGVKGNARGFNSSCVGQAQDEEDPRFACFFQILGKRPKEFAEFENFFVGKFPKQPLFGNVVTKATNRVYKFGSVKVEGQQLSFTTIPIRGVKYGFDGRFLRERMLEGGRAIPGAAVEGRLIKYRGGRKVAESQLEFGCGEGGIDVR